MREKDIEMLIANMAAAGCSDADVDKVRCMHEVGMDAEIIRCLKGCRCALLDELHEKQRNVDMMDKLIRSAGSLISSGAGK